MAGYLNRQDLKVDSTAVPFQTVNGERKYVLIYNCNIPWQVVRDDNQMTGALLRIGNLLQIDLALCERVSFQVTASYWLRNELSGEMKLWVGSFFGRHNAQAQLTRFVPFDPRSFVDTVFESTRDINNKLKWFGVDTSWTYNKLEAVIINVQSQTTEKNPILSRRNLLDLNPRNKRNHELFRLP